MPSVPRMPGSTSASRAMSSCDSSRAEYNVAGIEIENTVHADVYDNVATNNTGGILVFNMPDLLQTGPQHPGVQQSRFMTTTPATLPRPVVLLPAYPPGSGIVINANDKVEIFGNEIRNNQTANILISSYFSAAYSSDRETAPNFDPYPETIYIYDNQFEAGGNAPDRAELEQLRGSPRSAPKAVCLTSSGMAT